MAHFTRNRTLQEDEETRLEQLVFIVFASQVARYQVSHGRHVSVENPPLCKSWDLDVVETMLSQCRLATVDFDCCMYGAADPGNGLPYKKAMRIACSVDLSGLCVRCNKMHQHQVIEGSVASGPRKGKRRSEISGEYTFQLCHKWVALMRAAIGA